MKWISIDKAKPGFKGLYLVATPNSDPKVAKLVKSEVTATGVNHVFDDGGEFPISGVTHIAILTDPSAPES